MSKSRYEDFLPGDRLERLEAVVEAARNVAEAQWSLLFDPNDDGADPAGPMVRLRHKLADLDQALEPATEDAS